MANSTVLQLIQSFCREYGRPVPNGIQGSSDAGALQMRELLQTVGEEVRNSTNWTQCSRRAVWNSVAGEDQGALDTLFPEDFDGIVPQTFWDATQRVPMQGPVADVNWQGQKIRSPGSPIYSYKVYNGHLLVTFTMPVNHSLTLFYKSRRWINSGTSQLTTFATDNDTCMFSDTTMKKGLRAYWLRMKQMPHQFEMQQFEDAYLAEGSGNNVKPILSMDGENASYGYGITIPLWNVIS